MHFMHISSCFRKGRDSILVELNPDYVMLIKKRVSDGERKGKILSLLEYR